MKSVIKTVFAAAVLIMLFSVTDALAQVNQSNYRLQFAKGKKSAVQSRTIKQNAVHDIFFRAKKKVSASR